MSSAGLLHERSPLCNVRGMPTTTPPQDTKQRAAARAAYRIGMLDAMLHPDVLDGVDVPGIFKEQMRNEREYRLRELAAEGVTADDLADMRLTP